MVCLILYRFASEGRRSRKRVGGVEGETVRERLRVLEREVEREVESGLKRVEELGEDGLDGLVVGGGGKGKGAEKGEGGLRLSEGQKGMIRSLDELKALKKVCPVRFLDRWCRGVRGVRVVVADLPTSISFAFAASRLLPGSVQFARGHHRTGSEGVSGTQQGEADPGALGPRHGPRLIPHIALLFSLDLFF